MGRMALSAVVSWYVRWGLPIEKLWSVLLENPMLFLNYPYDVIPLKIKLFRHFAFTKEMGQVMLEQHPYILIWYNN